MHATLNWALVRIKPAPTQIELDLLEKKARLIKAYTTNPVNPDNPNSLIINREAIEEHFDRLYPSLKKIVEGEYELRSIPSFMSDMDWYQVLANSAVSMTNSGHLLTRNVFKLGSPLNTPEHLTLLQHLRARFTLDQIEAYARLAVDKAVAFTASLPTLLTIFGYNAMQQLFPLILNNPGCFKAILKKIQKKLIIKSFRGDTCKTNVFYITDFFGEAHRTLRRLNPNYLAITGQGVLGALYVSGFFGNLRVNDVFANAPSASSALVIVPNVVVNPDNEVKELILKGIFEMASFGARVPATIIAGALDGIFQGYILASNSMKLFIISNIGNGQEIVDAWNKIK